MRPEIKGYFLKEYGAWSVLITVSLIGAGVSRTILLGPGPALSGPWSADQFQAGLHEMDQADR